jgi:tetratricopeptide (TPR) repeat protein
VALDAVIHHYGKTFSDRQEYKAKYYLTLALQEVDKDPLCAHTQFNLMQQALAARQWEVAHRAATACINRNDEEAEPFVLFGNGLALKELGKHEEAIENFDKLLKLNPKHSLAMAQKGSSIVALGNVDAGRQLVVQALELAPGFAPTYQYLANLDFSQNNLDSARRLASEALRIAPNEPGMYDLLMKIDIADNDFEGAAKHALQGIENCLDGAKAVWYSVASAFLLKEGQREAGRSILELGIQAYPEDPELIRLKRMV